MGPKYSFWDLLMEEQGVSEGFALDPGGPELVLVETNYSVGDIIEGEIVEDNQ